MIYMVAGFEETLKLEKCPDKSAVMKIKLDLFLIKEIDIETISQMSSSSKALNDSFEDKEKTNDSKATNVNSDDPVVLKQKILNLQEENVKSNERLTK